MANLSEALQNTLRITEGRNATAQDVAFVVERLERLGFVIRPKEPTLAMLRAGYKALRALYPTTQEAALGQYAVYEAMNDAFVSSDTAVS